MTRINFDMDSHEYIQLQEIIGERNISKTFREFAQSLLSKKNETKLIKENQLLLNQRKKINSQIKIIELQLKKLQDQKTKELNEKLSFDPFAHISSVRDKQFAIYKLGKEIKKGKIPKWADNKKHATLILNKLIIQTQEATQKSKKEKLFLGKLKKI